MFFHEVCAGESLKTKIFRMQEKHVSLYDTSLGSNSDISQNIINGRQEWQHTVAC